MVTLFITSRTTLISRLLQTAEMLKPNLANEDSVIDHMPHLVTVYNRAQPSDLVPQMLKQTYKFYKMAFKKSRLQIASDQFRGHIHIDEDVNFVALHDLKNKSNTTANYDEQIPSLKQKLLCLPRHSFGPTVLTEKSW